MWSAVHLWRDGSLAIRRTQAMSTDGWSFLGDAVRFLQGGQRLRRVACVRPCLPNSIRKPSAGADRWCRIRWTAVLGRQLSINRSWDIYAVRCGSNLCRTRIPKLTWLGATMRTSLRGRVAAKPVISSNGSALNGTQHYCAKQDTSWSALLRSRQ